MDEKTAENIEKEFRELDKKEYEFLGKEFSLVLEAMMDHGFTRPEAMQIVLAHAGYIYDMGIEDAMLRSVLDDEEDDDDEEDIE